MEVNPAVGRGKNAIIPRCRLRLSDRDDVLDIHRLSTLGIFQTAIPEVPGRAEVGGSDDSERIATQVDGRRIICIEGQAMDLSGDSWTERGRWNT